MGETSREVNVSRLVSSLTAGLLLAAGCGGSVPPAASDPVGIDAPAGFSVGLFADGVAGARFLAIGPDGDVYLSHPRSGRVVRLPDANHDGAADGIEVVVDGLDRPHGLAFDGRRLYIAENGRVIRVSIGPDGGRAESLTVILPDLPGGGGHWTRTVVLDPAKRRLYVSIGSSCNVCIEEDPRRGSVIRANLDGGDEDVFARGLRNAVGLAFHPVTRELWATDNGRDMLGDTLPPEEVVDILREGGDYGWPACYGERILDPDYGNAERCAASIPPAWTDSAHVAPLGCAFYTGDAFPPEYRGDFFVACHGSWNRSVPAGYKVLHIDVEGGRPVASRTFLGGFRSGGRVRGRPVDVCQAPDGSLLVSDDHAGRVYRVTYDSQGSVGRGRVR
jgi:glucose/arabinose dehydrogenase